MRIQCLFSRALAILTVGPRCKKRSRAESIGCVVPMRSPHNTLVTGPIAIDVALDLADQQEQRLNAILESKLSTGGEIPGAYRSCSPGRNIIEIRVGGRRSTKLLERQRFGSGQ